MQSQKLKTNLRATEILLDAITGIGLLKRTEANMQTLRLRQSFVSGAALIIMVIFSGMLIRSGRTGQNWTRL